MAYPSRRFIRSYRMPPNGALPALLSSLLQADPTLELLWLGPPSADDPPALLHHVDRILAPRQRAVAAQQVHSRVNSQFTLTAGRWRRTEASGAKTYRIASNSDGTCLRFERFFVFSSGERLIILRALSAGFAPASTGAHSFPNTCRSACRRRGGEERAHAD